MTHVYLVDGTYELFRAYFAAPSWKDAHGREAGAARVLLRSIRAFIERESVTHIAYAFDHVIESFRNRMFDGYKTGEGVPEELLSQFELAENVTRALGVTTWPMIEFEADDAIATAAARLADDPSVERIFICANDKDLAQCVRTDRVVMYDRYKQTTLDEQGVVAKFGVPPALIPDWLALVGDTADGIPGVRHWGAKSAATVLCAFGALEQIPSDAKRWPSSIRGAARLCDSLAAARNDVGVYKTLATLRTDVPIETSIPELERHQADAALCTSVHETLKTNLTRD